MPAIFLSVFYSCEAKKINHFYRQIRSFLIMNQQQKEDSYNSKREKLNRLIEPDSISLTIGIQKN